MIILSLFFFFQAEDGIRDYKVTGVQTCALPISFRDSYEQFSAKDAQVLGVSSDSVQSHRRFARRHNLPFLLLSDRDGAVRRLYGVEKTLGLLPGRVTYVIDQTGVVRHVYSSQLRATRHPREALMMLSALRGDGA